jgi:hypothetical protein
VTLGAYTVTMIPAAALLASAGATVAVAAACIFVAKSTAELRREVDELKARGGVALPAPPAAGARGPQRMMSALYPERHSPLDWLAGVPAWPAFAAATGLAIVGAVLGLSAAGPGPQVPPQREAEIATLRAAVDSVSGEVHRLGDSLRMVRAASAGSSPRPAAAVPRPSRRSPTGRPASLPASPILPPPPSLQQIPAGAQTTP